ncbi:hypothetical protein AB0395_25300 [Streptosporangium sp. NPDC051023]|uniref:hypothetical protein n=1 Tax=Streptosporangium sp. NPDC051023 TaxID=3155410 RepID=UPI00344EDEC6
MTRSTVRLASVQDGATPRLCFRRAWRPAAPGRKAYLEAEGWIGSPDGPAVVRAAMPLAEVGMERFVDHGDVQAIVDEHHDDEVNP